MKKDPLIEALAETAKQRRKDCAPHVERLLTHASDQGTEEIRGPNDACTDELAEILFRPVGHATRDKFAESIAAAVHATAEPSPARIVPFPKRRLAAFATTASVLLAAAVLLLVLLPRRQAALPGYSMSLSSQSQEVRSAPSSIPAEGQMAKVRLRDQLVVVLRPGQAAHQPVVGRAAFVKGNDVRPWDASVEVSADGAVRLVGSPGQASLGAGVWDLIVIVSTPDDAKFSAETFLTARAQASSSATRRVLVRAIEISP